MICGGLMLLAFAGLTVHRDPELSRQRPFIATHASNPKTAHLVNLRAETVMGGPCLVTRESPSRGRLRPLQ